MALSPHYRNWAELHKELLVLISEKLVLLPDYIHFGAVCKGWFFAACDNYQNRRRNFCEQPPVVLLPPEAADEDHRLLYNIWECKTYSHPLTITYSKNFCGSSYGWLALSDKKDCSIKLFNPFYGNSIELPDSGPMVSTVKLSCDPCLNPNNWVALAIFGAAGSGLAIMRAGHDSWYYPGGPIQGVTEASFCDGYVYVMTRDDLFRIAIQDDTGKMGEGWRNGFGLVKRVKQLKKVEANRSSKLYFVELKGDLLLICMNYSVGGRGRVAFNVYKLRFREDQPSAVHSEDVAEWIEVQDFGDFSLFLGENRPICISTTKFPNCQRNCIYYIVRNPPTPILLSPNLALFVPSQCIGYDMGVYDLTTDHISHYYTIPSQLRMPPPVWISAKLG